MNFIDGILALAGSVQDLIGEFYVSYLDEMNVKYDTYLLNMIGLNSYNSRRVEEKDSSQQSSWLTVSCTRSINYPSPNWSSCS